MLSQVQNDSVQNDSVQNDSDTEWPYLECITADILTTSHMWIHDGDASGGRNPVEI